MVFNNDILIIDTGYEIERICKFISDQIMKNKKDGVVVGLSGGIDSSLISSLCVRALGAEKVFGLILPEKESNPISKDYAIKHAKNIGIEYEINDITSILEDFGTYHKRDVIISSIYKEYDPTIHRIKIWLPPDILNRNSFNFFTLGIADDNGEIFKSRLKKKEINTIVAATDTKQRTRMMHLYYYAEKMNRLVCGTTNYPETMQGFFVKYGDGGVDIEPIAHLYKSQVYQLAKELGVPREIIDREPSPDTFNSYVGDEEFFFRMPYSMLDILLFAWKNEVPIDEVCEALDLSTDQVKRVYRDFNSKYIATKHLRQLPPSLLS